MVFSYSPREIFRTVLHAATSNMEKKNIETYA